jgi:hypothetical protein
MPFQLFHALSTILTLQCLAQDLPVSYSLSFYCFLLTRRFIYSSSLDGKRFYLPWVSSSELAVTSFIFFPVHFCLSFLYLRFRSLILPNWSLCHSKPLRFSFDRGSYVLCETSYSDISGQGGVNENYPLVKYRWVQWALNHVLLAYLLWGCGSWSDRMIDAC